MCGIAALLSHAHVEWLADGKAPPSSQIPASAPTPDAPLTSLQAALQPRGPDAQGTHTAHIGPALLQLVASLLQLRGSMPSSTPLTKASTPIPHSLSSVQPQLEQQQSQQSSSVLCYNGEIFGGLRVPAGQNDGRCLLDALSACEGQPQGVQKDHVLQVLNAIRGPWSIIYWQPSTGTLWFGRDVLGQRSLLAHFPSAPTLHRDNAHDSGLKDDAFLLTSVAPLSSTSTAPQKPAPATNAPATNCGEGGIQGSAAPQSLVPATNGKGGVTLDLTQAVETGKLEGVDVTAGKNMSAKRGDEAHTEEACEAAVQFGPGVQGSGYWQEVPPGVYSLRVCDASKASAADTTETAVGSNVTWGLVHHEWQDPLLQRLKQYPRSAESLESSEAGTEQTDSLFQRHVSRVLGALRHAVQVRCHCIEQHAPSSEVRCHCIEQHAPPSELTDEQQQHSPILILFSGGVDSTLLAALAHEVLPPHIPIELSNVCFANGKSPDRLAAREALVELRAMAPSRKWRLIEVNSSLEEVDVHRQRILNLLHPAGTIMDLNIGAALWLAVGASGTLHLPPGAEAAETDSVCEGCTYASRARVVLLGHGADEQCGGYGRHRTRHRTHGITGLAEELKLDMQRMWVRNLGRDDRLVADWGKEARHPFLDEGFMAALLDTPLWAMADLTAPPGTGDKRILRTALQQLGLPKSATRVKRAIQFGSRIGKLSNVREFGSNRAANAAAAGTVDLHTILR